jgi:MFS family permease
VSRINRQHTNTGWLNRTTLGIGMASLFSDWSHEIATTVMPAFLASLGVAAAWLGLIEGLSDGLSSLAKMASGFYTDRLARRKKIAVLGYFITTVATGSIGLAVSAWQVLIARSVAWFGRGMRTPIRKALLAASVSRDSYGRAFGLERMMDTIGAIVGPVTAVFLLQATHTHYPSVLAYTLIPGFMAAGVIAFVVQEKDRGKVPHVSFSQSLKNLPHPFRKYLIGVGIFGLGDFAHSMLILLAAQRLLPLLGAAKAASLAAGLYVIHNAFYALFSFVSGWLADRLNKRMLLAAGYLLAAVMTSIVIFAPLTPWTLAIVFMFGGIYVAAEETLEDSLCAELVSESQHGMAFGVLATVNGIGDFASSLALGLLWTAFGEAVAFGYSAILFIAGAILVAQLRPTPPDRI